jgi:Putative beta barrel porin-7 (BBP7)
MKIAVAVLGLLLLPYALFAQTSDVLPDLPNGTGVSRPLQPVTVVEIPPAATDTSTTITIEDIRKVVQLPDVPVIEKPQPMANLWYSGEFLLGWSRGGKLPILATENNVTGYPSLADPDTRIALGGTAGKPMDRGGARFTIGWAIGGSPRAGFEVSYDFYGTQTLTDSVSGGGSSNNFLGRPLLNPTTGAEDAVMIAHPSLLGRLDMNLSSRLGGWSALGVVNLVRTENWALHALGGYRYFHLNEGLRLDQSGYYRARYADPAINIVAGTPYPEVVHRTLSTDQIDVANRFHGALLGLRSELERGRFFISLDAKVSIGRVVEVVKISGQTVSVVEATSGQRITYFPGGVYGQPSNTGRFERSSFGVLPEGTLRAGIKFGSHSRLTVGYNFLYLNDVVRPGDQIDRTVDLSQSTADPLTLRASSRPGVPFERSSYWVQGLSFGLEWKY